FRRGVETDQLPRGGGGHGRIAAHLLLLQCEFHGQVDQRGEQHYCRRLEAGFVGVCEEKVRRDPAMSATAARQLVGLYTAAENPEQPRLRLRFDKADRLPPMLIQAGEFEMLSADARYLDAEVSRAGGASTLEVWPGMVHVFQALPRLAPEAGPALRRAAGFISSALGNDRTDTHVEVC
ncbi:alpha/beta hydrolase, partial [Mycolicibacterium fortuitum]|uniref:alpha/beta hydrolase n=1 Tax=Mycolicibacterium fortuitum TaxID=1766 RepID=UPI000A53B057